MNNGRVVYNHEVMIWKIDRRIVRQYVTDFTLKRIGFVDVIRFHLMK